MSLEASIHGIAQQFDEFDYVHHIIEMEPEGVLFDRVVDVPTVGTIPQSNVGVHLRRDKLRQPAHTSHALASPQPEHQVLRKVSLDRGQEFHLVLVDDDPDHCVVHVEVADDLATSHHLGDCVVAHCHVGFVAAQRNGAEEPVLSEGVFEQFVAVFDSCVGRQSSFELGLEVRVVQQPQRTSVDIVNNAFLDAQQERLALVHQDLRNVLVHDDRTLDRVFGQIVDLLIFVKLALNSSLSGGHFIGLDLSQVVLSSHVSAQTDQIVDLGLQFIGVASFKVLLSQVLDNLKGFLQLVVLELFPQLGTELLLP